MARSDLVLKLIQAGLKCDGLFVRRIAETIAADEREKQHEVFAREIEMSIQKNRTMGSSRNEGCPSFMPLGVVSGEDLVYEKTPVRKLSDLILPQNVFNACREIVQEQMRADLLASYALAPRNRILLTGAPGNGKTSLAEAIAESMMIPMYTVKYEMLIGSYLGETAVRISRLFDFVKSRRCVLFLDEFDTIGKERGDSHDVGEVKRVVSTLLLKMDELPSYVVIVGATNHPELLDRAAWRRFQILLEIPAPTKQDVRDFIKLFEERTRCSFGVGAEDIALHFKASSFAELEELCVSVLRHHLLHSPESPVVRSIKPVLRAFNYAAVRRCK